MPVTLASFLMNTSSFLTRYQLCLNPATRTSVTSLHPTISRSQNSQYNIATTVNSSLTTASHSTTTYQIRPSTTFKILSQVPPSRPQSLPILSNLYTGLKLSSTTLFFTPGSKLIFCTKNATNPFFQNSIVLLPFHLPDWLHGLQVFFHVHVGFNPLALC